MKKSILIFGLLTLFLTISNEVKAQTTNEFFLGKWEVLVQGLPDGDTKFLVNFEKKDGQLSGSMQPIIGDAIIFSKVEENEGSITGHFTARALKST